MVRRSNLTRKRRTRLRAIESGGVEECVSRYFFSFRFLLRLPFYVFFSLYVHNAACSNESCSFDLQPCAKSVGLHTITTAIYSTVPLNLTKKVQIGKYDIKKRNDFLNWYFL